MSASIAVGGIPRAVGRFTPVIIGQRRTIFRFKASIGPLRSMRRLECLRMYCGHFHEPANHPPQKLTVALTKWRSLPSFLQRLMREAICAMIMENSPVHPAPFRMICAVPDRFL